MKDFETTLASPSIAFAISTVHWDRDFGLGTLSFLTVGRQGMWNSNGEQLLASKVWLWEHDVWVSDLSVRNESIDAWMDGKCLHFVCRQLRMFACVHICIYASRDEWFCMLDMCVCAYLSTCLYIYTDDIHASLHLYGCLIDNSFIYLSIYVWISCTFSL